MNVTKMRNAIDLAEKMSVPCHSDDNGQFVKGHSERLGIIKNELQDTDFKLCEENEYFLLYAKKPLQEMDGRVLLVSSHADCLQNKKVFKKTNDSIHGIFDNALTNAVSVYLMKYCDMPDNVIFAFTADEEHKSRGAKHLIRYLKSFSIAFNAIVLDVTYSGYTFGADFTIENDFIYKDQEEWIRSIIDCAIDSGSKWKFVQADEEMKSDNPEDYFESGEIRDILAEKDEDAISYEWNSFEEALADESYMYDKHDISCFSFCIPCDAEFTCKDGNMHDPKGFGVKIEFFFKYIIVLNEMCRI